MDYFVFGDVDSRDYNVWVYPQEIDSAPQREYQEVVVAGRNGTLTIDGGRYENIDHVYQCIIFSATAENDLIDFRNAIVSQIDYKRLEDSIHTNEFYEARFMEEFKPIVEEGRGAAKFEIKFNRKPQRYLKTGETAVTFPDGGESSPNYVPYPYARGTVTTGGITFTDNGDGTITANGTATATASYTLVNSLVLPQGRYIMTGDDDDETTSSQNITAILFNWNTASGVSVWNRGKNVTPVFDVTEENHTIASLRIRIAAGRTVNNQVFRPMICLESEYTGKWIPYWNPETQIYNPTRFEAKPLLKVTGYGTLGIGDRSVIITGTAGQEIYIDCEIMEAWSLNGSVIIPRNDYVQYVGNKFPVLASGVNGISMSGNITRVEVVPRWWRL